MRCLLCFLLFLVGTSSEGVMLAQGVIPNPNYGSDSVKSESIIVGSVSESNEKQVAMRSPRHVIDSVFFPPVQDQGNHMSCAGYAVGYYYYSFYHAMLYGGRVTSVDNLFSPTYIYQKVKQTCNDNFHCCCGAQISSILLQLEEFGNVPYSKFSTSDCYINPGKDLVSIAKRNKVPGYHYIDRGDLTKLSLYEDHLVNDEPVILCIKIPNPEKYKTNFGSVKNKPENYTYTWNAAGIKDNSLKDLEYHAVLLVGFDRDRRAFKILNSYGRQWGTGGYIWIDYDTFKMMIHEAYYISRVYEKPSSIPAALQTIVPYSAVVGAVSNDVQDQISFYGRRETIGNNRYYFSYGLKATDKLKNRIKQVSYIFDHPTFRNKTSVTTSKSNFVSSYQGWGCLDSVKATVYFYDGQERSYYFNGCDVLKNAPSVSPRTDVEKLNIQPVVTANYLAKRTFQFTINLRGIEFIKDDINKVEYNWNHFTFREPVITAYSSNNFQGGYKGWGCLENMVITIFFKNGQTRKIPVNMCSQLGWD